MSTDTCEKLVIKYKEIQSKKEEIGLLTERYLQFQLENKHNFDFLKQLRDEIDVEKGTLKALEKDFDLLMYTLELEINMNVEFD